MKQKEMAEVQKDLKILPVYIQKLFSDLLFSDDFSIKHNARLSLVKTGRKIIPSIHKLLPSGNAALRMEAAKITELIADKRSIPYLITLMDDPVFDIRWIASEGLIKIGRRSIRPLLLTICCEKSTMNLNQSAHHVLDKLLQEEEKLKLQTLMLSLDNFHETGETSPPEAEKALKMFRFNN